MYACMYVQINTCALCIYVYTFMHMGAGFRNLEFSGLLGGMQASCFSSLGSAEAFEESSSTVCRSLEPHLKLAETKSEARRAGLMVGT